MSQMSASRKTRRAKLYAMCVGLIVISALVTPTEAKADPISAAISAYVASISISSIVAAIVQSLVASVIMGGLSAMLSKKPKASNFDTSRTQMIKEAVSPRQYIFGRTRVSGAITFLNTFASYKRLEMNVTLAGHPCDGVETVYFDDNELTLDANGVVVGAVDQEGNNVDTWNGTATVKIGLGTPSSDAEWLAYAQQQTNGLWTADHKQTGCTKIWVTVNLNNKPGGGAAPNISVLLRGMQAYDPRSSRRAWTTNAAILFREYLVHIGLIDADGNNIDDSTFITAANACDEQIDTLTSSYTATQVWSQPDASVSSYVSSFGVISGAGTKPYVIFASPHLFSTGDVVNIDATTTMPYINGPFTSSRGALTQGYIRVINATTVMLCPSLIAATQSITDIFVQSYDWNFIQYTGSLRFTKSQTYQYHNAITLSTTPTRLRTGDKVLVSSTGTLPGGLAAATPYYVYQPYADTNTISLATSLQRALEGQVIELTSTGTGLLTLSKSGEARYTINGRLGTDVQPIDAIPALLGAFIGTFTPAGGKYRLYAGVYTTPTLSFDENNLDGWPTTSTRLPLRDNFNAVKGTFYSPAAYYESTNFPAVINEAYAIIDGAQSFHDIDLPFTNSPGMCQRIAKSLIQAVRQQITTTWPMNLSGLTIKAGDVVMLNRTALGWVNKPFQVTSWQLTTRGDGDNLRLGVDVTFREISPTVFDWNNGEESDIDDAPNTQIANPYLIDIPGAPVIVEQEILTNDSESVKSVVVVSWAAISQSNISQYEVRYKLSSDSTWTLVPRISGGSTSATLYGLAAGFYDFGVQAISTLGRESGFSTTNNKEILAQLQIPDQVQGLTIQEVSSLCVLRWTASAQPSVRINGHYIIRHSDQDLATASLSNSVEIIPEVAGNANHAVVPLKTGTYLVFARNSAGGLSATPAKVSAAGATLLSFSTFGIVQEDATFPGTHSNTIVDTDLGILKLQGLGVIDAEGDFDAIPDLDGLGGTVSSGTYTFGAGLDMGSVQSVRLETLLQTTLVNVLDSFDGRTDDIDDWANFDGTAPNIAGNAQIQVRTTNDDPAGSPTWGAWNWLVTADYNARAFQFQLLLSATDVTYNIYVSQLRVIAKTI